VSIFRRLQRQLAAADLETAIGRAERAIPAGTLIYTPSGRKSHVKSALTPGALCPDLRDWPGPWLGTGSGEEQEHAASLPLCPRCSACISGSEAAS
jgi:hypothetical protein